VDGELVERARERLTAIGHTPTLVTRDGDQGLLEYAPYDRIISTCAVPAIPRSWIDQTTEGGLILTDFKPSGLAGNLVLLERRGNSAIGRFRPSWAGFMDMRHADPPGSPPHPSRDHTNAHTRHTAAPQRPWEYPVPWFLAQFGMPPNLIYGGDLDESPGHTFLSTTDGSWCEVGAHHVVEGGPDSLWRRFEAAYEQWRTAGEPDWPRFGLTVTPDEHIVWLDEPNSDRRWHLSA
jgi:hypothetical protein